LKALGCTERKTDGQRAIRELETSSIQSSYFNINASTNSIIFIMITVGIISVSLSWISSVAATSMLLYDFD
jgi:hypothetical protein